MVNFGSLLLALPTNRNFALPHTCDRIIGSQKSECSGKLNDWVNTTLALSCMPITRFKYARPIERHTHFFTVRLDFDWA